VPSSPSAVDGAGAEGLRTAIGKVARGETLTQSEAAAAFEQIMSGGEILSPSHVRRAISAWPETTVVNAYGPTECTTLITYYAARASNYGGEGSVTCGATHQDTKNADRE